MELGKKKWTLGEATRDYNKTICARKCTNCKFGDFVAACKVKDSQAFVHGQIRAKLCKYFSLKV